MRAKDVSPRELVDFKNEPLEFEPGTQFRYSNSGYVLLGYVIEQVTGKSYAQYVDETFFQPLGMKNTRYHNAASLIPHRVPGYRLIPMVMRMRNT